MMLCMHDPSSLRIAGHLMSPDIIISFFILLPVSNPFHCFKFQSHIPQLFIALMNQQLKMQGHIFYRIISNSNPKPKNNQQSTTAFQRSLPLKTTQKKQEGTSLVYLSSLMQTENLLINRADPSQNTTHRQDNAFVTEKAASLPQTAKKQKTERSAIKSAHRMDILLETRRRLLKKENALLNIVGEYDPGLHFKKQNRGMEETIYKARTYTMIPTNNNFLPAYKKHQNQLKLKEEFTNFIQKQHWKGQITRPQIRPKLETEPIIAEYNHARNNDGQVQSKASNAADLYHFLKAQKSKKKRLKTHQPTRNYPELSKRMTEMILKNELRTQTETFNLAKMGKRKSFKFNIDS